MAKGSLRNGWLRSYLLAGGGAWLWALAHSQQVGGVGRTAQAGAAIESRGGEQGQGAGAVRTSGSRGTVEELRVCWQAQDCACSGRACLKQQSQLACRAQHSGSAQQEECIQERPQGRWLPAAGCWVLLRLRLTCAPGGRRRERSAPWQQPLWRPRATRHRPAAVQAVQGVDRLVGRCKPLLPLPRTQLDMSTAGCPTHLQAQGQVCPQPLKIPKPADLQHPPRNRSHTHLQALCQLLHHHRLALGAAVQGDWALRYTRAVQSQQSSGLGCGLRVDTAGTQAFLVGRGLVQEEGPSWHWRWQPATHPLPAV